MPQPLKLKEDQINDIQAIGLISNVQRPHLDVLASAYEVIANWASVEAGQLEYVVRMLGGQQTVATAAYLSLDGKSAKNSFIRAAAEKALGDIEMEYLNAVLSISKSLFSFRNKIAHWNLHQVKGYRDRLVLLDPEGSARTNRITPDGIFVFTKEEMRIASGHMQTLWRCYHYLKVIHAGIRYNECSQQELDELFFKLREMLLSVDNQLPVPKYPLTQ